MLQRLFISNFRCLDNFDLLAKDMSSVLLIGRNGSGKSTVRLALQMFRKIGRGINRVRDLVGSKDFGWNRTNLPVRFEIEVLLSGHSHQYSIALEFPENFKEPRVLEEKLVIDGIPHYTRDSAQVILHNKVRNVEARFLVDWHLIALPVIQAESSTDPLNIFKVWLGHMLILAPIPSLMTGSSTGDSLEPNFDGSNFGEWFSGVLGRYPAAYTSIDTYLREVMPDIQDIQNEVVARDSKSLSVSFKANQAESRINFNDLSDGEKCFFICALVMAANRYYGPLLCFWDEPDNYLSLSEVGHFIMELRRGFRDGAQIFMTSHNPEAILKFSNENTLVLFRDSHLEPTRSKMLRDFVSSGELHGDLVDALMRSNVL